VAVPVKFSNDFTLTSDVLFAERDVPLGLFKMSQALLAVCWSERGLWFLKTVWQARNGCDP